MIDRYTRPEMGALWDQKSKFAAMMEVEIAVAQAQSEKGIIPKSAFQNIKKKSRFKVERILEIEKTTKHDVIAFVSNLAENVGKDGRFIHYGMTSSDVLDTAMSLQVQRAGKLIQKEVKSLVAVLKKSSRKYAETLCSGRTHGIHAEPTTFGLKLAGHLVEIERNQKRFDSALEEMRIGKLSGAVGTYSTQSPAIEKRVCSLLKLRPETVATQVIPRDRHANLLGAMALMGAAIERLSVELRHLQRTEVGEVIEGFTPGQKGSSAMPHKKNPISAENLTGAARLLRGCHLAAMENVALWHERDISHSSVERVVFPDAFILLDYALARMNKLVSGLFVDKARMLQNMNLSQGHLFSSHVLLLLVGKGLSREDAYKHVQRVAHTLKPGDHMMPALLADKVVGRLVQQKELETIFSGRKHKSQIKALISKVLKPKSR